MMKTFVLAIQKHTEVCYFAKVPRSGVVINGIGM